MSDPLIIVGSGMAGLGLARQVRARDARRAITLITADSGADYSKPLLSTGFAKGMPPERLAMRSPIDVADAFQMTMRTHTRVDGIDPRTQTLSIGAERLPYGELVLATGAAPSPPFTVADEVRDRVFTINDLDDYRDFYAALSRRPQGARVAIVGAGLVGCEFADDLLAGGHRVALVAPEAAPLARLLPPALGRVLGEAMHDAGIDMRLGRTVASLQRDGETVALALDDGDTLPADLVLIATGLAPRTALADTAGLAVSEAGIQTDRYLATAQPGIHALGDCACVAGLNAMYVQPLQASAKALAATLTGTPTPVAYGAWPVLVKTPSCPVVALPPRQTPARWRIEGEGDDLSALAEDENGHLLGFALTGACVRRKVELARAAPPLLP
ncbi:FAD-dependent oxidoreductase [Chromohalobacter canadensis]|uniref:FAD-dependent oxidoreductase n=1 Tax=Chromohalobacter canadensis TaxID=141389 RepID=UPI0021BE5AC0|nr:FAD-dependent oxidoreductase [Chromohalobacter canadensis]MCT8469140.1 FAD-dependent oxidoreductase [Chromohalobacter canadensis]MCT8472670.1 FAD-dependent oxidoreductase [Chromohalobacter canadensis]MCT8500123.1 FAD-dependent oxidoreductase [Chromohalobacter canadensis]